MIIFLSLFLFIVNLSSYVTPYYFTREVAVKAVSYTHLHHKDNIIWEDEIR